MFVRNNWYVAAFSSEICATPLARRICGRPVVIFRAENGAAIALEDRCGHRGVPLSTGGVCEGNIIRCPYHGLEFDAHGACVRVPGQERIARGLDIAAFPVVEKDAIVWIWPGDPAVADPGRIVSHPYHSDSGWVWRGGSMLVNANFQLIVDNLLDLSHLQYVHRQTIGGDPEEESRAELNVKRVDDTVHVTRWMRGVTPARIHQLAKGYTGKIDRWQEFQCRPGVLQFHSGAAEANTGVFEDGHRDHAMHIRHFHGVTPQTETTSLYIFSSARNFRIDDAELTEKMFESTCKTFAEDKVLLEAQQARLLEEPDRPLMTIRTDAGIVQARRIIAERLALEAGSNQPAVAA